MRPKEALQFQGRKEWVVPLSIFLAALAVRLYLLFTHRYPMMIHEQDGTGYMAVAERIRSFHPFFDEVRPPAYPFIIALFSIFPIDIELAARIASLFMDALIVVPLYWLGRTFLSRSGAAAASLLYGFFSFSLYFSISPLSQSTFLFFLCCAILSYLQGSVTHELRSRHLFLSGALFAISYLARPEGVVPFIFACVASLLICLAKRNREGELRGLLFLAAGFLLTAGPYLLFLRSRLGYWGLTAKSDIAVRTIDVLLTLDAGGNLPRASRGIEVWKAYYGDIVTFLGAVATNFSQFATVCYRTFPPWFHMVAAIGLVVLIARKDWRSLFCLLLFFAATLPDYIVNLPKTHSYIYAVFPALFLVFVSFWDELSGLAKSMLEQLFSFPNGVQQSFAVAIVFVPALIMSVLFFGQARAALEEPGLMHEALLTERVYRESGRLVRSISQPGDKIMTRWGLIGYFAGREVVTLPKGGIQEVLDFGRRNGVRYLVIDTNSVLSRRQELMELLGPLSGQEVRTEYGIVPLYWSYVQDLGGYVIYRYAR